MTVYGLSGEVGTRWVHESGPLTVILVPTRARARHYLRDFFRAERQALAAAMRAHPAEVVSAHWTYEFALAAEESGLPAFVTAHDAPLRCAWEDRSVFRWLRNSLAVPAVHRAHRLSAVSPYTARHLERVLRSRGPVRVIPNGVRPADLPRASSPVATDSPVFATVLNGWGPLKNGQAALRAFGLARTRFANARLLMFGEGFAAGGPAAVWAGARGLAEGVEFVGPVRHEALFDRLAREVTVLVHPSRLEACPMVLLEAMAIGVPVVAGRRSGAVPWVLADGAAGLLADIRSPEAIADAMAGLGRDAGLRTRLAAEGRRRVDEHFDLDGAAAAYVRWFEAGLADNPR